MTERTLIIEWLMTTATILVAAIIWIVWKFYHVQKRNVTDMIGKYSLDQLDEESLRKLRDIQRRRHEKTVRRAVGVLVMFMVTAPALGQTEAAPLFAQPGILITVVLIAIPLVLAAVFLMLKTLRLVRLLKRRRMEEQAALLAEHLLSFSEQEIDAALSRRGVTSADDGDIRKKMIRVKGERTLNFVAPKRRSTLSQVVDPALGRLVIWFLACAAFWLIIGTTAGEYLGIKFVAPDIDHVDGLSFGKLRPVHTNAVFWGWSSLAMLGLAYYVVPVVSNVRLASIRDGYISLVLVNLTVLAGSIGLMLGFNNGGGEYREYPWPVMIMFGAALAITLRNFLITISRRKTREVYISNWYIVSAIIFTIVIAIIAYWPTWQQGLGETIVQGYYMHQGVGMWFMLFTLGLIYYFLPQQLNKPIYSYSLGILAFWTQVLFYTLIGTHHFVFSAIPWWLQTVAIVGSAGMLIPVTAGTVNFLMTLKGSWSSVWSSYILPFFLVGIVFYFTGSYQGTAEAFRYTNLLWHFTDFTVAHSHLTMYGIIAFMLWGCIYSIVPRITGNEPSQVAVGAHFWLAFVGLLFYTVPLMIGGTLRGLQWMEGVPFIETVVQMAPYWLWRAIGGTLMWISHFVFAYNLYRMAGRRAPEVQAMAFEKMEELKVLA